MVETRQTDDPAPAVHEAVCRMDGSVARRAPLTHLAAVVRRQAGLDVVVCGPQKAANRRAACAIEVAAHGIVKRHDPHARTGTHGLPHYQPAVRPPEGHTFYEVDTRKAVLTP